LSDKRPTYDLKTIKIFVADPQKRHITESALEDAAKIGYSSKDILQTINRLTSEDFYKTMESEKVKGVMQDVYRFDDEETGYVLYVKVQQNPRHKAIIISFKKK